MTDVIVRALGPVEIARDDGVVLPVGSRNQRVVLAVLAAAGDVVVATDSLVEAVWGDVPPRTAVSSLRTYVSRLRRVLGEELEILDGGYRLVATTDIAAFERAVASVHRATPSVALAALDEALALWRGPAFGDVADNTVLSSTVSRLEELRASAAEARARALAGVGRTADAVAASEAIVAEDPFREGAWSVLVEALVVEGRAVDALRAHRRAAEALAEAGLVPSAVLQRAERVALDGGVSVADRRPLPTPASSIVGRDHDLRILEEMHEASRVVTLVGPGGVGKTRLALELARRLEGVHEHGARLVELGGLDDPEAVVGVIAADIGMTVEGASPEAALARAGPLDMVVVLDNCEHVADAVAKAATTMVRGGDRVRVVATSRERLAIDGEHVWSVGPLATHGDSGPAAELFVARARAANPVLHITSDERRAVERIVRCVDGLPLAIEMAASRAAVMPLGELADRLEQRLDVLGAVRRGVDGRHATLDAVVEWSTGRLGGDDAALFADLSVFAGPVRADDVAIVTSRRDPLAALLRLSDRSLIVADTSGGRTSFGMLRTIREHAASRLDHRREAELARCHAEHFLMVATRADSDLRGSREGAAHVRLTGVVDELMAAHRWAADDDVDVALRLSAALHVFAQSRVLDEPLRWASALVAALDRAELPPHGAVCLASAAQRSIHLGEVDGAMELAERGAALADTAADRCLALEVVADILLFTGDLDAASRFAEEMAELAREAGDRHLEVVAYVERVLAAAYGDRWPVVDELMSAPPGVDGLSPSDAAWLAYVEGEAILDRDVPRALAALERAATLADSVGNRTVAGVARLSSCSLRGRSLDPREAAEAYVAVIALWRRQGALTYQVTTLRNVVDLLGRLGDHGRAAELLGALDVAGGRPSFGEEGRRMETARDTVRGRLGADAYADAVARGARRSVDEAASAAVEWLTVEPAST